MAGIFGFDPLSAVNAFLTPHGTAQAEHNNRVNDSVQNLGSKLANTSFGNYNTDNNWYRNSVLPYQHNALVNGLQQYGPGGIHATIASHLNDLWNQGTSQGQQAASQYASNPALANAVKMSFLSNANSQGADYSNQMLSPDGMARNVQALMGIGSQGQPNQGPLQLGGSLVYGKPITAMPQSEIGGVLGQLGAAAVNAYGQYAAAGKPEAKAA